MISWRELSDKGLTFTEDELNQMLQDELANCKRVTILKRIHQRMGTLRQQREWEFIKGML